MRVFTGTVRLNLTLILFGRARHAVAGSSPAASFPETSSIMAGMVTASMASWPSRRVPDLDRSGEFPPSTESLMAFRLGTILNRFGPALWKYLVCRPICMDSSFPLEVHSSIWASVTSGMYFRM